MTNIQSFRDLDAWKASMKLALEAYSVAKQLPASERFELSAQARRCFSSIECCRGSGTWLWSSVSISRPDRPGFVAELVTHLELVKLLKLLAPAGLTEFEAQLEKTGRLLHGLHRSLKRRAMAKGLGVVLFVGWLLSSAVS